MPDSHLNPTPAGGAPGSQLAGWSAEESYWRDAWATRPYAVATRDFDYYRPAYRYGFESAQAHQSRFWDDVEPDLRTGWARYEHRADSAWGDVEDAVRDAWERVTNP